MSEKFIITAAHCTYGATSGDFFVGLGKCCNKVSLKIDLEGPVTNLLGVPSNLKLRSECNFRRLWGGRGWERVKAEASPRLY